MNRIYILLLTLALGGGVLYFASAASTARDERDDFDSQLRTERLRTQRLRADVLAATAKADAARRSLKEALDAAPTFRDAPVPVPVRDSLCATLRCK